MADEDQTDQLGMTLGRGFMLWQIANGWQRAARAALTATGLTYVQVLLLAGLADRLSAGEKVSQSSLAQSLGADAMMTSQVLRALETAGLVERRRDTGDTRARTLALTDAGRERLSEAMPILLAADEHFFDPLGKKEERFLKSLRKLWRKRRMVGMTRAAQDDAEPAPADAEPGEAPEPKRRKRKGDRKANAGENAA